MQKPKEKCSVCFKPIKSVSQKLSCRTCSMKLHVKCLTSIFPHLQKGINSENNEKISDNWQCFVCENREKQAPNVMDAKLPDIQECMFCGKNSDFLLKIDISDPDHQENQTFWAHYKCICQRGASCERMAEKNGFLYKNLENYKKRGNCNFCNKPFNIECCNCGVFFKHFRCPLGKDKFLNTPNLCLDCKNLLQKKKESQGKTKKKHGKSALKTKKKQRKNESQSPSDFRNGKIEEESQVTNEIAGEDQSNKQNSATNENINKKKVKEFYIPNYKTKAPDLLIEVLNNIMSNDFCNLLRKSTLGVDIESCELFQKFKEKYAESPYFFAPEDIFRYNEQKFLIYNAQNFKFDQNLAHSSVKLNSKYNNIDSIHEKATKNVYFTYKEFEDDLFKMFNTVLKTRCQSQTTINYLNYQVVQYLKNIKIRKLPSTYLSLKLQDLSNIFSQETTYKMNCTNWPVIPKSFRHYETIESYEPVTGSLNVKSDLKAYKIPKKCPENCACFNFETLGEFSLEFSTWVSACPNRAEKIECDENSHPGSCKNMGIGLKQRKILGEDVEERLSWGIDIYTRKNIYWVLPDDKEEIENKFDFIQNKLMKAINLQKEKGYDMKNACNFIIENSYEDLKDTMFGKLDRKYAKMLLQALNMAQDPEAFRIHSKGQGLICINKKGFKKNEFIVEYFGEIYPPWYWYEKQDLIKKFLKEKNKKNVLLDFYNIMLEIHKNDPKGYNVFFVDPIQKGNYSSRLSHSCDPNCGTVTTVVNGQYVIGMYAMKDISYGEELTFDYCSVTEEMSEFKKAFCLCGTKKCRGKYLGLVKTKESNTFLEQSHGFLERNNILLRACREPVNSKDHEMLESFHLKERIMENMPEWMKKWMALTLEFIEKETEFTRTILNEGIPKDLPEEEEKKYKVMNEISANNNKESRFQNLVITCDKVKYFIKQTGNFQPPFVVISEEEIFNGLWGKPNLKITSEEKDSTIINDALKLFLHYKNIPEVIKCINLINFLDSEIQTAKNDPHKALLLIRLAFLMLSQILKDLDCKKETSSNGFHRYALSDIFYFYAFTHTYFRPIEYIPTQSAKITVRKCDISNIEAYTNETSDEKDEDILTTSAKSYKGTILWGQLVGWFKQTVVNPEASLSQDRRGTLSYPVFSSSFWNFPLEYPFQKKRNLPVLAARADFLSHISKKPSYNWPPLLAKWSYKNPQKMYGTVLFENQVLSEKFPNYLSTVIKYIDAGVNEQLELFENVEMKVEGNIPFSVKQIYEVYSNKAKEFRIGEIQFNNLSLHTEKRKRVQLNKNILDADETKEEDAKTPKIIKKKKISRTKEEKKAYINSIEKQVKTEVFPDNQSDQQKNNLICKENESIDGYKNKDNLGILKSEEEMKQ